MILGRRLRLVVASGWRREAVGGSVMVVVVVVVVVDAVDILMVAVPADDGKRAALGQRLRHGRELCTHGAHPGSFGCAAAAAASRALEEEPRWFARRAD
jgi:hypothetical protein